MFRVLPYIALFFTAVLSQIFIFDNLTVSVFLTPLVYLLFIILLPVECSRILLLGSGIVLGYVIDVTMGTGGLNSIATIFVAYFREPILRLIVGAKRASERGVPSEILFGDGDYLRYLVAMVTLHHFIFFAFESLSFAQLPLMLVRFIFSSLASLLFIWLFARLFTINKILK